jgi:hypothetical protein
MRYPLPDYLEGFLWWIFIKFCKTDLEAEQAEDKRVRKIFFTLVIGTALAFVSVKLF